MTLSAIETRSAQERDAKDPLRGFRDQFLFPQSDGRRDLYFLGNSLGLQPKRTRPQLERVLEQWHSLGVRGHFEGDPAWIDLPELVSNSMADLVGARGEEVVVMNTLTVNLQLMLATFYQPSSSRHRILMEHHAFPSDYQAVTSHLKLRGRAVEDSLVTVRPADSDQLLATDSVLDSIREHRDSLAVILLPGVQYYTGEVLDIPAVTAAAHEAGIVVGLDLAHAAGNVPLQLHDWDIDFACWCTYKYLNSGPGALGACFIHDRHATDRDLPRLAGWWGHERESRFAMRPEFVPSPTALGWQLSNPPILSLAAIRSSLEIFHDAGGMSPLRAKSLELTGYLRSLLEQALPGRLRILTPCEPDRHGCQLSLEVASMSSASRETYRRLEAAGVRVDWREPNVIRVAPVPLYNGFDEVRQFVDVLSQCLD